MHKVCSLKHFHKLNPRVRMQNIPSAPPKVPSLPLPVTNSLPRAANNLTSNKRHSLLLSVVQPDVNGIIHYALLYLASFTQHYVF